MINNRNSKGQIVGNSKHKSICKICQSEIWDYRNRNVCSRPKNCINELRRRLLLLKNPAKNLEIRKILREKQLGDRNNQWNGGKIKVYSHASQNKTNHYVKIKMPTHPYSDSQGYIMQHRLIMEEYLGRYLLKEEIIHHINWDKSDNRIENLLITNASEHQQYHVRLRKFI